MHRYTLGGVRSIYDIFYPHAAQRCVPTQDEVFRVLYSAVRAIFVIEVRGTARAHARAPHSPHDPPCTNDDVR